MIEFDCVQLRIEIGDSFCAEAWSKDEVIAVRSANGYQCSLADTRRRLLGVGDEIVGLIGRDACAVRVGRGIARRWVGDKGACAAGVRRKGEVTGIPCEADESK